MVTIAKLKLTSCNHHMAERSLICLCQDGHFFGWQTVLNDIQHVTVHEIFNVNAHAIVLTS